MHTATLRIHQRPRAPRPIWELVGEPFGGVAVDDGGGIFIGGKFHPVPPRGPESVILQQLAAYLALKDIADVRARGAAQRAALKAIATVVASRSAQLEPLRSPAPIKAKGRSQ